jgi:L-alanine-DL-glutamate epimerase-like enolase superfamily enzyme
MKTRIVALNARRYDFHLRHPSVVAYETLEIAPNVVVRVELANGLVGYGNAAPDQHVTGETAESVEHTINQIFKPVLLGAEATEFHALTPTLSKLASRQPTALAAIDIALWDLFGKLAQKPLYQMLGVLFKTRRERIETFVTLSIEETALNVESARDLQARGFKALKIKCGLDATADIARVQAVRAAVGKQMRIALDANQGYSVAETLRVLAALADCDIAFIEQPVKATDAEGLRELCERSPIPVMADESVLAPADVMFTPAPLVNLKLMKCGGVSNAILLSAAAQARKLRLMVGCMDESRISMAAAAHVALALDNVDYADLDGHLDIVDDVAQDGLWIENGEARVSDRPGLGLKVDACFDE